MLKATSILFSGSIVLAVANLLRVVVVARLLSLEDFGIAATFNVLLNAINMAFGFSLGQMLIQAPDGDKEELQAGLQFLQLAMGALLFVGFFAMAGPYSTLMGTEGTGWAYQMLALFPLLVGLVHFDIYRLQRSHKFTAFSLYNAAPVVVSLLSVWPLYLLFGDWRVMPFALMVQGICGLVISHGYRLRPYRLRFLRPVLKRGIAFGGPLFLNAILLFVIVSGDRMIVSNRFGLEDLAWFSTAFMLTLMPVNMVIKNLQSLMLPGLSREAETPAAFAPLAVATCEAFAFMGAAMAVFFVLFGEGLLLVLFGSKYAAAAQILALLGVMQGLRCARAAPNILAMAQARTRVILYASILRALFIALAAAAVFWGGVSLAQMILIGCFGELAAMGLAFALLGRGTGLGLRDLLPALLCAVGIMGLVIVVALGLEPLRPLQGLPLDLWGLGPALCLLLSLALLPGLRAEIMRRVRAR